MIFGYTTWTRDAKHLIGLQSLLLRHCQSAKHFHTAYLNCILNMSEAQAQTPFAGEPEQQAGTEQQLPETVEAVVDGGQPNGYKIVRSATGKQYVEVSKYRGAQAGAFGGDTGGLVAPVSYCQLGLDATSAINCAVSTLQAKEYDPLEHHRSVSFRSGCQQRGSLKLLTTRLILDCSNAVQHIEPTTLQNGLAAKPSCSFGSTCMQPSYGAARCHVMSGVTAAANFQIVCKVQYTHCVVSHKLLTTQCLLYCAACSVTPRPTRARAWVSCSAAVASLRPLRLLRPPKNTALSCGAYRALGCSRECLKLQPVTSSSCAAAQHLAADLHRLLL